MLTLGLIVNPYAGIGGPLAQKGSDGLNIDELLREGGECKVSQRIQTTLDSLLSTFPECYKSIFWKVAPGIMGEDIFKGTSWQYQVIGKLESDQTQASDTERLAGELSQEKIDLLLFAGGDGTARNIVNGLKKINFPQQFSLGIPAGVKMHSGVFAVSPQAAGRVLSRMLQQKALLVSSREVRDIDESALRQGQINARYYGELQVPDDQQNIQQVKDSGRADETAVQTDIAEYIVEQMKDDTFYLIGCGTTPKAVMDVLGLENSLLGIDVIKDKQLLAADINAIELKERLEANSEIPAELIITAIGGQGHIIGRGNQQLSADVLKQVRKQNTYVLITPSKLEELEQRPLLIDSGDVELDKEWSGWIKVYTGYEQTLLYPLTD